MVKTVEVQVVIELADNAQYKWLLVANENSCSEAVGE